MPHFVLKIIPIVFVFFLGFLLKRIKVFSISDGKLILNLVFYVTLPALTFLSVAKTTLTITHFYLPFLSIIVVSITYLVASWIGRRLHLSKPTFGSFLVGCLIMNTGFTMPFVIAAFEQEGLTLYTFFDLGNCLLIYTFIYYQAIRYGENGNSKIKLKKFLNLPPIWGLLLGTIANLIHLEIPLIIENSLHLIGTPTVFLMMLSLGIYFHPRAKNVRKIIIVLLLRIGLGGVIGLVVVKLFDFSGILKTLIVLFMGAPVGYNTLIFSSLEKLDEEFAASIVSISLLLGIVYIPLLLIFYQ